ncbi:hypothetical protein O3M35_006846 [Rhynocoris fuscipes]|uniref:Uncharacterized protein n=1 Tax=Rhynocoris fuscipes TaxID=488301 RepID=A0AAW1DGK9_9HEMI
MILLFILFGCILGLTVSQKEIEYDLNYSGANGTGTANYPPLTRITRTSFYPSGFCTLPWYAGINSYTRYNCQQNCLLQPGTNVPTSEIVKVNCNPGYGPPSNTQYDAYYTCVSGNWFYKEPQCIKLCPALKQEHLNIECIYGLEPVSCYNYMRPGTVAKFRCDEFYQASYDTFSYSDRSTCLPEGRWSEKLPTCSLVCGKVNQVNKVDPTLLYANKTRYGEYPWHVAIYTFDTNRYKYICGGSLIAENFVLTAAHCMFNPNAYYAAFTKSSLKVAVGKGKRDYYIQERYQVNSDVVNIIVPETYVGDGTRYAEDIALLETEVSFVFNHFVLPVCLDRFGVVKFHKDIKGTIIGWGYTENNTVSDDLLEVRLPIMPIVQCREMFRDFIQFLTTDKYCVIHQNGSGIGLGDSGGGMTFDVSGQHYVRGIVSIKKTDSTLFSAFTNVSTYMQWIYDSMKNRQVPANIDKICENWKRNQVCMNNEPVLVSNRKLAVAKPRILKYMAYIARRDAVDGKTPWIQCIGVLISDRWVLTADCIGIHADRIVDRPEMVILGDADVFSTMDDSRPQIKKIIDIILHPHYKPTPSSSSFSTQPPYLALLKLDSPIIFDEYVAPACLHTSAKIPVEQVVLTGRAFVFDMNKLLISVRMLVTGSFVNDTSGGIPSMNQVNTLADNSATNVYDIWRTFVGAPMTFTLDGGCTWTLIGTVLEPNPCDQRDLNTCTVRSISNQRHFTVLEYLPWIKSVVWPDI